MCLPSGLSPGPAGAYSAPLEALAGFGKKRTEEGRGEKGLRMGSGWERKDGEGGEETSRKERRVRREGQIPPEQKFCLRP